MEINNTQIKLSAKDRAWSLYMELRKEKPGLTETALAMEAITLMDNFDRIFYEHYQKNKLNQK